MAINAKSFLAGAGAALATVILGFGAGVTMTDALFGKGSHEPNRLERRAATDDVKTVGQATAVAALPASPASPTTGVTNAAPPVAATPSQPVDTAPSKVPSQEQASAPTAPPAADSTRSAENDPNAGKITESRAESRRAERQRQRAERRRIWAARRSRGREQELDAFAEQVRRQDGPSQFEEQPVQRAYTAERSFMPFRFGDD